jgi:hypothetical protein
MTPGRFDRRVVADDVLHFIRAFQARVPCRLGGGAASSGAFLFHRLSRDIDLIRHERASVRSLAAALKDAATEAGGELRVVQDAGDFVRAELRLGATSLAVDVVLDTRQELEPPASLEGITLDARAASTRGTARLPRRAPRAASAPGGARVGPWSPPGAPTSRRSSRAGTRASRPCRGREIRFRCGVPARRSSSRGGGSVVAGARDTAEGARLRKVGLQ